MFVVGGAGVPGSRKISMQALPLGIPLFWIPRLLLLSLCRLPAQGLDTQGLFFFPNKLFIFYFWLHWVFVAARGLSLVAASGGYSSLRCAGFSLRWLLLLRSTGSRRPGFSICGT